MNDLVAVIGSAPYGVSAYRVARTPQWAMVLLQRGRNVTDVEANLLQQIRQQRGAGLGLRLGGAGVVNVLAPANGGTTNIASIHSGSIPLTVLIDGELIEVRGATDQIALDVTLTAAPGSGTRTDLIFLEIWNEEIQPSTSPEPASTSVYRRGNSANSTLLTNDLINPSLVAETSRRVQRRYRILSAAGVGDLAGVSVGSGSYATFQADSDQPGAYVRGDGTRLGASALSSVDGYRRAIVLATVSRPTGQTTIPASAITAGPRVVLVVDSDRVDQIDAATPATANKLLPLDSLGKYPSSAFTSPPGGSTADAATVDGFDASASPVAGQLLALDSGAKFANAALRTGSGNGLDVDSVDTFHANATPTASTLLPLDSGAKFPNSVLKTGSGNGLDADSVDGLHASGTPAANRLLPLDSGAKFANATLRTGSGNGLDADTVDTYHANAIPTASTLLPLDSGAKFPNSVLKTGSGNGLDADLLDGLQATQIAQVGHTHAITYGLLQATDAGTVSSSIMTLLNSPTLPSGLGRAFVWLTLTLSLSGVPINPPALRLTLPDGTVIVDHGEMRSGAQTITVCATCAYSGAGQFVRGGLDNANAGTATYTLTWAILAYAL